MQPILFRQKSAFLAIVKLEELTKSLEHSIKFATINRFAWALKVILDAVLVEEGLGGKL